MKKALRISGIICGLVVAAMLVLQAICIFYGHSLRGATFGIELLALAIWCATDAIIDSKKPKHPYLKWVVTYQDSTQRTITMRADDMQLIPATPDNPIVDLAVTYFESDKDEARKNGKTN